MGVSKYKGITLEKKIRVGWTMTIRRLVTRQQLEVINLLNRVCTVDDDNDDEDNEKVSMIMIFACTPGYIIIIMCDDIDLENVIDCE